MAAGQSSTRVRKGLTIGAHIGIAACMFACATAAPALSIAALLASGLFLGANAATIFPIGQVLGGRRAAGKWMGAQNCIGNIAGILAPIVTGRLVDTSGSFTLPFAIAATVALSGTLYRGLLLERVEPMPWR